MSFGNISKSCIWRFKVFENIGNSNNRELTSKGKWIIFIECLFTMKALISSCLVDDITVGDGQNGMSDLFFLVVLDLLSHVTTNRTLAVFLIKSNTNIETITFVGEGYFLNIVSFKIEEFEDVIVGNERRRAIVNVWIISRCFFILEQLLSIYYKQRISKTKRL